MSIYQDDLAYIHHVGFSDFAHQVSPELLKIFTMAGITSGTVVDLGCGGGIWLNHASKAGFEGVGIDQSETLIALAKATCLSTEVGQSLRFHVGALERFELPPCQVVTALSEVLSYRQPNENQEACGRLNPLFQRVFQALPASGLFLFDVMVEDPDSAMNYQVWKSGPDWAVMVDVSEDKSTQTLTRQITTFRSLMTESPSYRRSEETHQLHIYCPYQLEADLAQCGFSVISDTAYGSLPLASRRRAFIAQKDRARHF